MDKTATIIKDWTGLAGHASLYRLSEPLEGHEFVVVSAVTTDRSFTRRASEPETYLFPADESGAITDWLKLPGSQKGTLEHADALRDAGYEIIPA